MANIYPHKTRGFQILFKVYIPDGTYIEKYRFRNTKPKAEDILRQVAVIENGSKAGNLSPREILAARHAGLLTEEEARLLAGGKAIEPYDLDKIMKRFETKSANANTPYGHIVNMRRAKKWCRWLEKHPIPRLTQHTVEEYVKARREGDVAFENEKTKHVKVGVAPKTIRNELEVLRGIIDCAVEMGTVEENVAREVYVPVKNKKARRSFTREELQLYFAAAHANKHLCHGYAVEMSYAFLYTGFRRSEIAFAEWKDYRPEERKLVIEAKEINGKVVFTPKSGEAAIIDIPEKLCKILDGMERKGRWIFGGVEPISVNRFYKTVKEICARAGLDPKLSPHHLRHTYISWVLRETGGDLAYAQEQARHSDPRTTRLYIHSIGFDSPIRNVDFGESDFSQNVVIKTTRQRKPRTSKGFSE